MTPEPVIGASPLREEALDKTTGATRYTADIFLPGMLYAKACRSPYPHARIRRIDATQALAMPGVLAVLTAADLPDRRVGLKLKDMPLLATDVVRFVGERVAVVAAVDPQTAAAAAQAVDVEYEPLPAVFDPETAMTPDAPVLHPDLASLEGLDGLPSIPNACFHQTWQSGNLAAGFAASDLILEATYTTQPQHQCYMEPRTCQVAVAPDGKVTVWSTNKTPFPLRRQFAEYTGLPPEQINVISTYVGGDFGGKGVLLAEPLCYYLALRTSRPVRFSMTREEELVAGNPRHASRISIKAGVTRDGRIQAWQARVVFNAGAYAAHNVRIIPGGAIRAVGPYRIPHVAVEALSVYTNVVHHGHMRAPGDLQTAFAVESHMDALAAALGLDAAEFRLLNAVGRDDPSPLGKPWHDNHLRETIELALRTHRQAGPPPAAPAGFSVGTGMACTERYNGSGKSGARVRLNPDGSVTAVTGAIDVGTGLPTLLRQIVAAALELPLAQVHIELGDTDGAPYDQGVGSSRHTPVAGNAALQAATALRRQAAALAEELLECPAELLVYEQGAFRVRGTPPEPRYTLSMADLARALQERGAAALEGVADVELVVPPETCFAAAVADVAVDLRTGQVKVLRVVSAHDVGKALNPRLLRSQIEGAVLQGAGFALTENLVWDAQGQVITPLLSLYGMPSSLDVPAVVAVWVEGAQSPGPFGAKSVAEAALAPIAPAIANAVRSITGGQVRALPLTGERVLALAEEGRAASKRQVQEQFQKTADSYVTSQSHAQGADLALLTELAQLTGTENVLDVATGAGHVAFAFAPRVHQVVGVDLTPAMLERAAAGARQRGLANVRCQRADVEALPFAAGSFDVVTCRIAAHHFPDLTAALREMARVLKPGGRCIVVDNVVPEGPALDAFINEVERLRDPSHVRAHSVAEWQAVFTTAGLSFRVAQRHTTPIDFAAWTESAQTSPANLARLHTLLAAAPAAAVAHFAIQLAPSVRFQLHKAVMVGVREAGR